MKIWRKEHTKPVKEEKAKDEEELTDISQSSTQAPPENKKDKMEEIYSTKDKQVKYKRMTPLEAEEAAKRAQKAKDQLTSGKAEITLKTPIDEQKDVELTSDYEEGTVIADDIIEDVDGLKPPRKVNVQDIDEIDIDIDPAATVKKYERQVSAPKNADHYKKTYENEYEKFFGKPKYAYSSEHIVEKIPTYQHDSKINLIHLKAGRFTDVVENEYDEYLKSKDTTVSKRGHNAQKSSEPKPSLLYALSQLGNQKASAKEKENYSKQITESKAEAKKPATKNIAPKKPENKVKKFFRITKAILFPKKAKQVKKPSPQKHEKVNSGDRQDAKFVAREIATNFRKLTIKGVLFGALFLAALIFSFVEPSSDSASSYVTYCFINLLILVLTGVVAWPFITNGLRPLRHFKGNSDTTLSCAFVACLLQQLTSLFAADLFVGDDSLHIYTTIIALAYLMNIIGRLLMVSRVKDNFKFITTNSPAQVAKMYADEENARKMLSGTTASHSTIAYQHPTKYLSDFLKISYAPDPSEDLCGKFAPITIVISIFVSIVYGFIASSFVGALCALAVMLCISIPLCAMITSNLPMKLICKNALKQNAMISGYPTVKQFSQSQAVMVRANELYPKGCVKLNKIKNFVDYRVEESLLAAAVILKESQSPLAPIFDEVLKENKNTLPKVESVMFEDKLGLVGWVAGERVLIGNRQLLDRFHIYLDDAADEALYKKKGCDVTYIACAGQLVSMLVTKYTPDKKIAQELKNAQANGLCIVVSTTDSNITVDKISQDYELFYRTVKVLKTGYANACNEVCNHVDDTSHAFLATRGKFSSLIHAVSSCVSFRHNLTIGLIVQVFGLILGILLSATMVLYDSVSILGVTELILYMLFWGVATVAVQLLKRKI